MKTILVTGSRNYEDRSRVAAALGLHGGIGPVLLLHGAARGADSIAASIAQQMGFRVQAFPADWKKYGKRAGPVRNDVMLDQRPDLVLAFGHGRGTDYTVRGAERRGIPVKRY